jgi:MFS superfamily sulfate permease-like transporter
LRRGPWGDAGLFVVLVAFALGLWVFDLLLGITMGYAISYP